MFAVKGWSVDAASLKPQTEIFKSKAKEDRDEKKSDKKRKRGQVDGSNGNASNEDVGKLWERHIEGKKPPKQKKMKERKRQKLGDSQDGKAKTDVPAESPGGAGESSEVQNERSSEKKSKKKDQKERKITHQGAHSSEAKAKGQAAATATNSGQNAVPPVPPLPAADKLTPMQSAMRQKLVSARFRHLNETLYTKPSTTSLDLFDKNPEMFEDYHAGFRQQVSVWPENPVDKFIEELRSRGKIWGPKKDSKGQRNKRKQDGDIEVLPRTHGTSIIADLGCGDARLAQTLKDSGDTTKHNLKLHSYDLHSQSPLVTKADISNLPLKDGSVDIAIFCLALMGTNWISFIEEAYRILHWRGELWIAEIKSRFGRVGKAGKVVEHSVGSKRKQAALKTAKEAKKKADEEQDEDKVLQTEVDGVPTNKEETDVSAFVDVLKRRGFVLKTQGDRGVDLSNKMFVKMEFVKAVAPTKGKNVVEEGAPGQKKAKTKFIPELEDEVASEDEAATLKPCLYKIR